MSANNLRAAGAISTHWWARDAERRQHRPYRASWLFAVAARHGDQAWIAPAFGCPIGLGGASTVSPNK